MGTNLYCTLTDLKSRLRITATDDDALLTELLEDASRTIDDRCGRRFYLTTGVRFFSMRVDDSYLGLLSNPFLERRSWSKWPLDVGDLVSVTKFETNDSGDRVSFVTWDPALDYYLEPVNAAVDMIPYSRVRPDPINGHYWLPPWPQSIRITGTWGYAFDYDGTGTPVAPPAIREACFLIALRLYKRKDAPFGVAEAGAMERWMIRLKGDSDITELLAEFMHSTNPTAKSFVIS